MRQAAIQSKSVWWDLRRAGCEGSDLLFHFVRRATHKAGYSFACGNRADGSRASERVPVVRGFLRRNNVPRNASERLRAESAAGMCCGDPEYQQPRAEVGGR